MKKIMVLVIFLLMSLFIGKLNGQSVEIISVDANSYPFVTVGFKLFDGQGNEIRNFFNPDIIVQETTKEGADPRMVMDVVMPSITQTTFSTVFSIDISQSMEELTTEGIKKREAAIETIKEWIKNSDPKRTELAITAFCADAIANVDNPNEPPRTFTNDKDSLLLAIEKLPITCAGTNYNAAFLHKRYETNVKHFSSLYYCNPEIAKYKPVLVFLTDGNHIPEYGGVIQSDEIFKLLYEYGVTVYVVKIGDEELSQENMYFLQQLSLFNKAADDNTPNMWLGVKSATELNGIYQQILSEAGRLGDPPPCYVTFKTDCNGGSATLIFPNHGNLSATVNYTISDDKKPDLEISPETLDFSDTKLNEFSTKEIILSAIKSSVEIENLEFIEDNAGSDRIEVVDWGNTGGLPFTLDKDSSCKLTIKYDAIDESQTKAKIKFIGSSCEEDVLNITASPVTDIEELIGDTVEKLKIEPNPAENFFNIVFPHGRKGNVNIIIYDLMGNEITNFDVKDIKDMVQFNVESLSSGYYFVGCFSENIKEIVPLVISR